MPRYVVYPVDTNPEDIIADVIAALQLRFPGWQPNDGNIDTALIEAFSASAADNRDLMSQVTEAIFRQYGASLIGLPPQEAQSASVGSTWVLTDTLGHTIQAGTQVGLRNSAGDLVPFVVVSTVVVAPGGNTTAAGAVQLTAANPGIAGSGLGGNGAIVELIDPIVWVASITATAVTTAGVDAELDDDYLDRLRTFLTLLTPTPILPQDFADLARQVPGVYRAAAIDGYNPFHNLMTLNEGSIETDASGWAVLANVTLARTLTQFADGAASLQMTATAAADMSAVNTSSKTVSPGETITGVASFRASATAKNVQVGLQWRDGADAVISTTLGATVGDLTTGWVQASVTGTAPATAAKVRLVVQVLAAAASGIHFVDKASLRRGTTTDWVPGGTADTGNARTISVVALDVGGNGVDAVTKNNIDAYLQGRREVNFLVFEADPAMTQVDVTVQVKILPNFTVGAVQSAVSSAISAFLSPATWGARTGDPHSWFNTTNVRFLELATAINNVAGVDYITTTGGLYDLTAAIHGFTMGRADIVLPGVAPLPSPGTITVTAVP